MKHIILLLLAAAVLSASPVIFPDGVPVSPEDPRIGAYVYADPGSLWYVWGNDNPPPGGDLDYNDAVMRIQFDFSAIGTAHWAGSNSAWQNFYVAEGLVVSSWTVDAVWQATPGDQVQILLSTPGGLYYVGSQNVLVQSVPEPAFGVLVGIGLVAVGWRRR